MWDILLGKYNSGLIGVAINFNMWIIIVNSYCFVIMRKKIRAMRKKKKYRGKFETIENLTIQNYRFIFISLISLFLCFFIVITSWFSFYDNIYNASSYDWKEFFFREFFIMTISLFTSILSLILYVSNKIAIDKLKILWDQTENTSSNSDVLPSFE